MRNIRNAVLSRLSMELELEAKFPHELGFSNSSSLACFTSDLQSETKEIQ